MWPFYIQRLILFAFCTHLSVAHAAPQPLFFKLKRGLPKAETDYQAAIEKCEDSNCRYKLQYQKALALRERDRNTACALFSEIKDKNISVIQSIVALRTFESCPASDQSLKQIDTLATASDTYSWVKSDLLKIKLSHLIELKRANEAFEFLKGNSVIFKNQKEKLETLEQINNLDKTLESAILEYKKQVAPRFQAVPENWWDAARDALQAKDYVLAREGFLKVLNDPKNLPELRRKALESVRQIDKVTQNKSKLLATSLKLVQFDEERLKTTPNDSLRLKDLLNSTLYLARLHWTEHRAQVAKRVLQKFLNQHKNRIAPFEVYVLLGRIDEESRRYNSALRWYEHSLQGNEQDNAVLFRMAWTKKKLKDLKSSNEYFERLLENETESWRRSQLLFWIGKNTKQTDSAKAQTYFEKCLTEDPTGFYGIMAQREMGTPLSPLLSIGQSESRVARKIQLPPIDEKQLELFGWLNDIGEWDFSQKVFNQIANQFDPTTTDTLQQIVLAAHSQSFATAFSKTAKLSAEEKINLVENYSDALFPQLYSELVFSNSEKWKIDPYFPMSIIRQESSFNPLAISSADAYGLMQILPSVAQRVSKRIKFDQYHTPDDLLDPEINVPIGVALLREQWDKFHGQFVLITASYNASEDAVKSWVKTRYENDPIEFIEDIPYEETRMYVKLVLRNYISYLKIQNPDKPLDFPEWTLKGIRPER